MSSTPSEELPPPPAEAEREFGERLAVAEAYARHLAGAGVERGLLGPREAPRLWERHLVNCVRLQRLIPDGASVLDVGSGAGLPGMVLAIRRPDVTVTLLEPLLRRSDFLAEAAELLELDNVTVVRGRAEQHAGNVFDVVTSRAVAPLGTLTAWCLPLARPGGRMLALKGSSAPEEVDSASADIQLAGGARPVVHTLHGVEGAPPTVVVEIERTARRPRKRRA